PPQGLASRPPICALKPPPVHAKRVAFKDELGTPQRPPGATITQKPGGASGCSAPPGFVPQPCTIPDYVVRYPAIRSTQQRWQYGAVFTDQHAEFRQLLAQVRAQQGQRGQRGQREDALTPRWQDAAFVAKQQRCLYLKAKLTHLKAQIQEYDRSARGSTVLF
ncbi:MALD2 protein, partial [Penelope pileata]|nr:MALD2 protein [Penelope pileata]